MSAPAVSAQTAEADEFAFDVDALRAVRLAGAEPRQLWHADDDLTGVDAGDKVTFAITVNNNGAGIRGAGATAAGAGGPRRRSSR